VAEAPALAVADQLASLPVHTSQVGEGSGIFGGSKTSRLVVYELRLRRAARGWTAAEATVDARVHAASVQTGEARLPLMGRDLGDDWAEPERSIQYEWEPPGVRSLRPAILSIWPASERARAACIAGAETTGTQVIDWYPPRGAAGECGPWQIHPVHAPKFVKYGGWERCADPMVNALVAFEIWSSDGFAPWTTAWRCR
jgi:hypothetical protein